MTTVSMIRDSRNFSMVAVTTVFYSGKEGDLHALFRMSLPADGGRYIFVRHAQTYRAHRMKRTFFVKALWDNEAQVFYSHSDIEGLHIEAPSIDAFEAVMFDAAIDLIVANHISASELAETPMKDLIPAILWERPTGHPAAA